MYEKEIVICDNQEQYARNLMKAFSGKKPESVNFSLFFSVEELLAYARETQINILLISQELSLGEKIDAKRVFILKDQMPDSGERDQIFRYQSSEQIWKIITQQAVGKTESRSSKQKPVSASAVHSQSVKQDRHRASGEKSRGSLIGVYSPIHRIGKTAFAVGLGKSLSKKQSVLYLNMEEYADAKMYFSSEGNGNLSDLIYYARQDGKNLGIRISMIAGADGNLDYIEPMPYVQDLKEVSAEEWMKLFDQILSQCIYEKVVLDLGDCVDGLYEILQKCEKVYTPYIEDRASRLKLMRYEENLKKTGKEDVLEKTIRKKMSRKWTQESEKNNYMNES